jgi:hypothetical protein
MVFMILLIGLLISNGGKDSNDNQYYQLCYEDYLNKNCDINFD